MAAFLVLPLEDFCLTRLRSGCFVGCQIAEILSRGIKLIVVALSVLSAFPKGAVVTLLHGLLPHPV